MCGRFVIELSPEMVKKVFGVTEISAWPARYNITPSQLVPVVRQRSDGTRQIAMMRWGLVPAWAKEAGKGLFNARCETAGEKPSFRHAIHQRRCIIPSSGFYEWAQEAGKKIPYYVQMTDGSPMPFAALWESWRSPDGQVLDTCAILTTVANSTVAPIHGRMPVILHPDEFGLWLDRQVYDPEKIFSFFSPYPADSLTVYSVSPMVNNPANDSPECIERAPE